MGKIAEDVEKIIALNVETDHKIEVITYHGIAVAIEKYIKKEILSHYQHDVKQALLICCHCRKTKKECECEV